MTITTIKLIKEFRSAKLNETVMKREENKNYKNKTDQHKNHIKVKCHLED